MPDRATSRKNPKRMTVAEVGFRVAIHRSRLDMHGNALVTLAAVEAVLLFLIAWVIYGA